MNGRVAALLPQHEELKVSHPLQLLPSPHVGHQGQHQLGRQAPAMVHEWVNEEHQGGLHQDDAMLVLEQPLPMFPGGSSGCTRAGPPAGGAG